jgi:hypothetical protein
METIGYTLYFSGMAGVVAALIWSFVVIFRENALLAVICLFLPWAYPSP